MFIRKCYIENFGKISDKEFVFDIGKNVICEENGWGKSTLAAFIRVMFFGFENEGKRDSFEKERLRYKPWQGGVYGGKIEFNVRGKEYILFRTFGSKNDKEDEFVLKDKNTNMESSDFSRNIGEELFGIDSKSFMRTVFIAQNDCVTATTDKVNAKIGNLAENTDDINNYENVDKHLKDLINELAPNRKTGKINKMNGEITELKAEVSRMENIDKSIDELAGLIRDEKNKKQVYEEEKAFLNKKQMDLSALKDKRAVKEKYESLCNEVNKRREQLDICKKNLGENIPEVSDTQSCLENVLRYNEMLKEKDALILSDNEINILKDIDSLKAKGVSVQEIEDYIAAWNERTEKKSGLSSKKATLNTLRSIKHNVGDIKNVEETDADKNIISVYGILGIMFISMGIFAVLMHHKIGITGIIAGIMWIIADVIKRKKKYVAEKDNNTDDYHNEKDECSELEIEIASDEGFIENAENKVYSFFRESDIDVNERNVIDKLYDVKNSFKSYAGLLEKNNRIIAAENELKKLITDIDGYYIKYELEKEDNLFLQIQDILKKTEEITRISGEYNEAKIEKEKFEASNNVKELLSINISDESESMEENSSRIDELTKNIELINNNLHSYDRQIEKYENQKEELSVKFGRLEALSEEITVLERKYKLLCETKEILGTAKVNFTQKYMQPLLEGFKKYYKMLNDAEADKYSLDANTNVLFDEAGMERDSKFLSSGYKDLVGICMRMALVSAMYEGEKPFVVFDDPFVNLDKEKTEGGMRLLDEIAEEYQIIYFTCHESRV